MPFSDFQYVSRSSQSTEDLLTVVFDKITWAFNWSEPTRAVALDIFKAFDSLACWYSSNLGVNGISGQIFGFISSFLVIGGFK